MPRKLLRRWLPDAKKTRETRGLRWLAPLLQDANLFHLNRQSVSLGFFVGVFCAFLPMPAQTIPAALMALLLRANLPLSVALIWISNPVTMPPMLYACYELGRRLLGMERVRFQFEMNFAWFSEGARAVWLPLLTGSFIAGLVAASLAWLGIRLLWHWHVVRNWEARKRNRNRSKPLD